MITIDDKKIISYPVRVGERGLAKYTLKVDDVSDLPVYNALPNYDVANGSTAYVTHEGKMYVLDSDGKWYGTDGSFEIPNALRTTDNDISYSADGQPLQTKE